MPNYQQAEQYGSIYSQQYSATDTIKEDMVSTLRSVRDTLSTSFQTLNLTLSSMQNTLRTMTSNMGPRSTIQPDRSYIPAMGIMSHTGSMSPALANRFANSSTLDIALMSKPFNVSSLEWGMEQDRELRYRMANMGGDATFTLGSLGISGMLAGAMSRKATSVAGNYGMGAIARSFPGRMALGLGAFGLAGAVVDPVFSYLRDHAEEYNRDVAGVRRMSNRFGSEFTLGQSQQAAKGIGDYGIRELRNSYSWDTRLGAGGYRNLMMQGLQSNMFQGRTPEDLTKQMEQAAQVTKFLAGIMGSKDVNDAMQAMVQLKQMGINAFQNSGFASQMGLGAFKYGSMMGVSSPELLKQSMAYGHQVYASMGLPSFGGIMPMMQSMATAHEMEKRGMLSPAMLSVSGGHTGVAQAYTGALAGMMANDTIGGMMLAGAMGPNGQFSASRFNAMADKGYMGIVGQAANLVDPKQYAKFIANRADLHADLSKQANLGDNTALLMFKKALDSAGVDTTDVDMVTANLIKMGFVQNPGAAKQMAQRIVQPDLMNNIVENQANRYLSRAVRADRNLRHGVFSGGRMLLEDLGKVPDKLDYMFGQTIGRKVGDFWNNLTGQNELDNGPDIKGVHFNLWDNRSGAGSKAGGIGNFRHINDFRDAWQAADLRMQGDGTTSGNTYLNPMSNAISDLLHTDIRKNIPGVEAMWARNSSSYRERLRRGTMTALEAFQGLDNTHMFWDTESMMQQYGQSRYAGTVRGGIMFAADHMDENRLSGYEEELKRRDLNSNGSLKEALLSSGIKEEELSKLTKNQVFDLVRDSNSPALKAFAQKNGITINQASYLGASQYGQGQMSKFVRLNAADKATYDQYEERGAAIARANKDNLNIQEYDNLARSGIHLNTKEYSKSLETLGMTYDDIVSIGALKPDEAKDINKKFSEAVAAIYAGEKVDLNAFNKVPALKQRLSDLSQSGASRSILSDKGLGSGIPNILGLSFDSGAKNKLQKNVEALLNDAGAYAGNISRDEVFKGYFGFKEEEISGKLDSSNPLSSLLGLKGGNDTWKKLVRGKLSELSSEINDVNGNFASRSQLETFKEKYGLGKDISSNKKDIELAAVESIMQSFAGQAKAKEAEDKATMGPYADLVDNNLKAWKVTIAGSQISDVRNSLTLKAGFGSSNPFVSTD